MIDDKIRGVLATSAGLAVDANTIADDADLFGAGMTSHATVSVMLGLEDAFDVEFPTGMLQRATFATVASIRSALAELGATAGA